MPGTAVMAFPENKLSRHTPRNSDAPTLDGKEETPYTNLRHLAGLMQKPSTPLAQVETDDLHPGGRSTSRNRRLEKTPLQTSQTPREVQLPERILKRQGPPTTPHAIRAQQQRRTAALTPRGRRKSGRMQRETPRDALRNLSRILARNTKPSEPSPLATELALPRNPLLDELDDEPNLRVPRLSMPLDDMEDDDSFYDAPPRLSVAFDDEENDTVTSLEAARRALNEQRRLRSSRGSFGSVRLSQRFTDEQSLDRGTVSDGEMEDVDDIDGGVHQTYAFQDYDDAADATQTMEGNNNRLSQGGSPQNDATATSDTAPAFVFTVPQRVAQNTVYADQDMDDVAYGSDSEGVTPIDEEPAFEQDPPDQQASDQSLPNVDGDASSITKSTKKRTGAERKTSKYGITYPSLPSKVVKRLALTYARGAAFGSSRLSRDALGALVQASDSFFEQVAEDLVDYAEHAGRKRIDEADVVALMKRQRQINASTTAFSLAQKYLPRELLQGVRMATRAKMRASRRPVLTTIAEVDEEIE